MVNGLRLKCLCFCRYGFQKSVWYKLLDIPYGSTVSYGELAKQLDMPKAVRAVAAANGANAISILLRVIVLSAVTTRLWGMAVVFLLKTVTGFGNKRQTSVMNEQETLDYARIAQAIGYIRENFKRQPGLDEIAREVALSTAHFQRMFTEWAGVSPKKFLQYTSIEYAKKILDETHASLFDTAQETGLSGTGRLYDLFVNIEGMTPGEYKTVVKIFLSITVLPKVLLVNYLLHLPIKVFVVWSLQTITMRHFIPC